VSKINSYVVGINYQCIMPFTSITMNLDGIILQARLAVCI